MVSDEVITTSELRSLINSDRVRIIDAREPESYKEGHIPGAVNLHPSVLECTETLESGDEVEHQLRPLSDVVIFLRAAGVSSAVPVCVYDDGGGYLAGRIWWVLDYLGHPKCRFLDGGLVTWTAEGGPTSGESVPLADGSFLFRPNHRRCVGFSDVITASGDPQTVLCNALPEGQFVAEAIPGSINIPYTRTFAEDNFPLLKSRHELERMFLAHGVTPHHRLILYCQIGYSASQVYFAARYAGVRNVAVYDGSMGDWIARGGGLLPGGHGG